MSTVDQTVVHPTRGITLLQMNQKLFLLNFWLDSLYFCIFQREIIVLKKWVAPHMLMHLRMINCCDLPVVRIFDRLVIVKVYVIVRIGKS